MLQSHDMAQIKFKPTDQKRNVEDIYFPQVNDIICSVFAGDTQTFSVLVAIFGKQQIRIS